MRLSKQGREALRMKFGGRCSYCGCDLRRGWHADHLEPVEREWWKSTQWWKDAHGTKWVVNEAGDLEKHPVPLEPAGVAHPERDKVENLMPACRACNLDKHASSLEAWRRQLEGRVDVCRRNYSAFRHAERFGLVQEIKKPVVFWFERCLAAEEPKVRP